MRRILSLVCLACMCSFASAQLTGIQGTPGQPGAALTLTPINLGAQENSPIPGDVYSVTPGLGNAADGFFLASANRVDATIGASGVIGQEIANGMDIIASDLLIDNMDGTTTLVIDLASTGDLIPAGFSAPAPPAGSGGPLDLGAFFLGASLGGNPVDFATPAILAAGGPAGVAGAIFGFDAAGMTVFGFDISTIVGDGTVSGPGAAWNGSVGVNLGAGAVGAGVVNIQYLTTFETVPEPATCSLLGAALLGFLGLRRR